MTIAENNKYRFLTGFKIDGSKLKKIKDEKEIMEKYGLTRGILNRYINGTRVPQALEKYRLLKRENND